MDDKITEESASHDKGPIIHSNINIISHQQLSQEEGYNTQGHIRQHVNMHENPINFEEASINPDEDKMVKLRQSKLHEMYSPMSQRNPIEASVMMNGEPNQTAKVKE